jgi:hypothetical protein
MVGLRVRYILGGRVQLARVRQAPSSLPQFEIRCSREAEMRGVYLLLKRVTWA